MSDPNQIIEQCDVLIGKYEEGLKLVRKIRKDAIRERDRTARYVEVRDAWGRPTLVKRQLHK